MNTEQGLLAELKTLQRFASERLAERESKLRELSDADSELTDLKDELAGFLGDPEQWRKDRQALVDDIEELSHLRSAVEARLRRLVDAAGDNARQLESTLEETRLQCQRAQQAIAEHEADGERDQDESRQHRKQLATRLTDARRDLNVLRQARRRHDEQRNGLLTRLAALEQEQNRMGALEGNDGNEDDRRQEMDRQVQDAREELKVLQAARQDLNRECGGLMERVADLELASDAAAATQAVRTQTWEFERSELEHRLAEIEQVVKAKQAEAAAERSKLLAELSDAQTQLSQLNADGERHRRLQDERKQLKSRIHDLEQRWLAREAAISQERALRRRQLDTLTLVDTPTFPVTPTSPGAQYRPAFPTATHGASSPLENDLRSALLAADNRHLQPIMLAVAGGLLLALPFITTFDDFLVAAATKLGIAGQLQAIESQLVVGGPLGESRTLFISWAGMAWQSLVLSAASVLAMLPGRRRLLTRFTVLLVGLVGAVCVNLLRTMAVAFLAVTAGQTVSLAFHDYGGTLIATGWLFFFLTVAGRWTLRPAVNAGRTKQRRGAA